MDSPFLDYKLPAHLIAQEPGPLRLTLVAKAADGHWLARPDGAQLMSESPLEILERHGQVPLPPYVRKGLAAAADRDRYQTVFARRPGAVAAPTAGLHFTPELFERLGQRGIGWTFLTLHVGLGTFQPIETEDPTAHRMHREWGELPATTATLVNETR